MPKLRLSNAAPDVSQFGIGAAELVRAITGFAYVADFTGRTLSGWGGPAASVVYEISAVINVTPEHFEDPSNFTLLVRDMARRYTALIDALEVEGWQHLNFPRLVLDGEVHPDRTENTLGYVQGRVELSILPTRLPHA